MKLVELITKELASVH